MYQHLQQYLLEKNVPEGIVSLVCDTTGLVALVLPALIIYWISRYLIVPVLEKMIIKTQYKWDDILVKHEFFQTLSFMLPTLFLYAAAELYFHNKPAFSAIIQRTAMILFILAATKCVNSCLSIFLEIYTKRKLKEGGPLHGYVGIVRICSYLLAAIFILAVMVNKSPWGIVSLLGGLTAVLLLIFKDTILGFVASLQLFNLDMVRVGDWIEMPSYDADGDVLEVNIHTVKIQNWDKTITTIPTYALVSNSFKNWRGMSESGGRRIKRALFIDMNTIKFCTDDMLKKFGNLFLLNTYITEKQKEINSFNADNNIDPSKTVNSRRQTNIGIFRAYIKAYLKNNPQVHQNMTFLVRQLAPTAKGLPIEIYVFSKDQVWANYEDIQADIFDHILAVVPEFELRVFQEPSGNDFKKLQQTY